MFNKDLIDKINKLYSIDAVKKSNFFNEEMDQIKARLQDDIFRIAVVGEFSSGKSTFINALIGKDILLHSVNETTAAITNIHNVKNNEPLFQHCIVDYNDGKQIQLENFDSLKVYTTVQSNHNVARDISLVSIFVNFLNVSHPTVVVDTPGLNGIADKHREITINEVKKAHVCIYLLSMKGLTNSDIDFIKILQNYQSKFIFVQNFIDTLRISEGETAEQKIEIDKKIIEEKLCGNNPKFEYTICGVSALKALAAKDKNIKKLYDSDEGDIDNREELYNQSNFKELEEHLENMINSGKYMDYIISSAEQSLCFLIDNLLLNLQNHQHMAVKLKDQDNYQKKSEKIKNIIKRLEEDFPKQQQKIKNFIISSDKDNRDLLKEWMKEEVNKLYIDACGEIDKNIKVYEDFDNFEFRQRQSIPEYISGFLSQRIDTCMLVLNEKILADLAHIYDSAVLKIMNITSEFVENYDTIKVEIKQERNENFKLQEISWQKKIEQYRAEVNRNRDLYEDINSDLHSIDNKIRKEQRNISAENESVNALKINYEKKVLSLGKMPDVKYIETFEEKLVPRSGFLGGLRTMLFGKVKTKVPSYVPDDTEQREWKRKRQQFDEERRNELQKSSLRIAKLNDKIVQLNIDKKNKMNQVSSIEGKIRDLENRVAKEQSIYENAAKINRQEFCDSYKNTLKRNIEEKLFGFNHSDCTLYKIKEHIDEVSKNNIPIIESKIVQFFQERHTQRISELNDALYENEEVLENKFKTDENDINLLINIRKSIAEENV